MNYLESKCNSGCESGWTTYLEDFSISSNPWSDNHKFKEEHYTEKREKEKYKEDEEDLSMVSDASSGPPHFHEHEDYFINENGYFSSSSFSTPKSMKKINKKQKHEEQKQYSCLLDDTASSPVFNFITKKDNFTFTKKEDSMDNFLNFSHGFTTTNFKEGSTLIQKDYGLIKSSLPQKRF